VSRSRPIVKLGDTKGLKYRGYGWANLVMAEPEFGSSATFIPGQELYSALQTGILDWCEYDAPNLNYSYGLYEVTKYDMYPGIHEMTRDSGLLFPMKVWDKFPEDLKAIMTACCGWNMLRNYAKQMWDSADLTRPGGKIEAMGVQIKILEPAFQDMYNTVSNRLADAEAKKDPKIAAIWADQQKVFNMIRPYMKLQTPSFSVK
jgi:TRAP-type mannitol/chloroaromatic compound transport system substrate-binding protein